MNPIIARYFDTIEVRLIHSPVIISYQIVRREIAHVDGKLRIKVALDKPKKIIIPKQKPSI